MREWVRARKKTWESFDGAIEWLYDQVVSRVPNSKKNKTNVLNIKTAYVAYVFTINGEEKKQTTLP